MLKGTALHEMHKEEDEITVQLAFVVVRCIRSSDQHAPGDCRRAFVSGVDRPVNEVPKCMKLHLAINAEFARLFDRRRLARIAKES